MGGTLNPTKPLDPTAFAYFLGVNDAGDGKGTLTAPVVGGLGAGSYRACTMSSSSNHAPVIMPVAQRGAQDDCTKFTVTGGGGGANNAQANKGAANTGQGNKGVANTSGAKPSATGAKPNVNGAAKNTPAKTATGNSKPKTVQAKPPGSKPNNKRRFVGLSARDFVA